MKSLATLLNLSTTLSQNLTSANQSLMLQLMNDEQRYLIQKYFDNERSVTAKTIGAMPLTLSSTPAIGDTSATLATAWNYPSCSQVVNFGDGESRPTKFIGGNTTISWDSALTGQSYQLETAPSAGDTSATLSTAWPNATQSLLSQFSDGTQKTITFTEGSTAISWAGGLSDDVNAFVNTFSADTGITTNGVQYYSIPANISKITDNTITVGQLKFTIIPIQTRTDWDKINFLPYSSDIPQYAFIYNGVLGVFPIPSTTGNLLSFNFKSRVPDFSTAFLFSDTNGTAYVAGQTVYDYQKGTVSGSAGSTAITGSGTAWTTPFPTGDVTKYNLYLIASPTKGDGMAYPISTIDSDTGLTLALPLIDSISSGASYSIAQMPILFEDFQDMLVYGRPMHTYFSSIVPNPDKFKLFDATYKASLALMEDYIGTKQLTVDLGAQPNPLNPNLFLYAGPNSSS